MDGQAPQTSGELDLREEESAFVVFRSDDPEDWLARFEKGKGFPAREWAENMVRVYNGRLSEPPVPPGRRPGVDGENRDRHAEE